MHFPSMSQSKPLCRNSNALWTIDFARRPKEREQKLFDECLGLDETLSLSDWPFTRFITSNDQFQLSAYFSFLLYLSALW